FYFFFFQAEDGIRDRNVTGVQTCALPIYPALDADGQAEARGRVPHVPPDPAPRGGASRGLHGTSPQGLVPHGGLLQARVEPLLPARAREESRHGDDRGPSEAPARSEPGTDGANGRRPRRGDQGPEGGRAVTPARPEELGGQGGRLPPPGHRGSLHGPLPADPLRGRAEALSPSPRPRRSLGRGPPVPPVRRRARARDVPQAAGGVAGLSTEARPVRLAAGRAPRRARPDDDRRLGGRDRVARRQPPGPAPARAGGSGMR